MYLYIYIYIDIYITTKFQIKPGTKSLMSKCVDHKTTFLDKHRHFRPATEISRSCSIVCGGLELKKSNLRNKTCLDAQHTNDTFELFETITNIFQNLCVNIQGYRMHNLHLNCALDGPCFFTHGVRNTFSFSIPYPLYLYASIYIYIHIYTYIYIYISKFGGKGS